MSELSTSSLHEPERELPPILPEWAAAHSLHYQLLANQQIMLEDVHRTSKYHSGIQENATDFRGKTVLDVGAGTGILSLFAARAGAKKVYAVEGTAAAEYARQLIEHAGVSDRVEVLRGRLDQITLDTKVDVIISEPWGFFLFHERMIEVFLQARDRFLVPGGKLFPSAARLCIAPFCDDAFYQWRNERLDFWERKDYFGVDLTAIADAARRELYEMPAVGLVDPASLSAEPAALSMNLYDTALNDLACVRFPFRFTVNRSGLIHGLAGWFDVMFGGSDKIVTLSTAPDMPPTHWAQIRFLFPSPIELEAGAVMEGRLILTANAQSSYDVMVELASAPNGSTKQQRYRLQAYFPWQNV
ncbi:MAG TPA: class I SAM-dependent methyltransferase [Polyangiaceae bacterium]